MARLTQRAKYRRCFIPSLINRGYVLDLMSDNSLLRWLSAQGIAPYLLEWGRPDSIERGFNLDDYVGGRLRRALHAVVEHAGQPVALTGYCMGGLLAMALAQLCPAEVTGLALLATPWDFAEGAPAALVKARRPLLETLIARHGELPVDMLQAMFMALDPLMAVRKFTRFARLDPTGSAAELFVALEDWLNDGVPLAGPAALDCLVGWYCENRTMGGLWRVNGTVVDPAALTCPVLAFLPQHDRLVPPASAAPLPGLITKAVALRPPLGHIGMIVGGDAPKLVWKPLAGWLKESQEPRQR